MPSLREYFLISHEATRVEHYSRRDQLEKDLWMFRIFENPTDELVLESADCRLRLSEIYKRVKFEASNETNI